MIETVFRTDDVPRAERFDFWCACVETATWPLKMSSPHTDDFRAGMHLKQVGTSHVWRGTFPAMRFQGTPRLIRQFDPANYHVSVMLRGSLGVVQEGHDSLHGIGGMYLVDAARPVDCYTPGATEGVALEIPRALLPLPRERVSRLLARPLGGQQGIGALLSGFLTRLAFDTTPYRSTDGPRLETVLVDLLSATLAHHLDAEDVLPSETRRRALTLRIKQFVRQHLQDPGLSPAAVAAAHHISVSHLHRLFKTEDTTVAAWIRRQRLEHARRDLANPALRQVPVHSVAARWGFSHHAVFTRTFTTAYGLPPATYRQQALARRVLPSPRDAGPPGSREAAAAPGRPGGPG